MNSVKQPFGLPEKATACQHSYLYRELGGVAFRCCESCGQTHIFWQFTGGEMMLLPVPEADMGQWQRVVKEQEERDAERDAERDTLEDAVADVAEALLGVSAGEDERPVSPEPDEPGRPAQPVQDVQEPELALRPSKEAQL